MPTPAADLFPSTTLFPGSPLPVDFGGYGALAEISLDTLILTSADSDDTLWVATDLGGWLGSPASSLQLTQRARSAGAWASPRQMQARTITAAGGMVAASQSLFLAAIDRLNAAAAIDARLLTVSEDGLVRSAIVYRQDEVLWTRLGRFAAQWSVQLSAPDPRKFGAPLTAATALPSATGGLAVPFTVPFSIDSTVVSGSCFLTNPGNAVGPVTLRIDGPITGPVITHVSSGLQLVFSTSLTLGAGEWLEVDMEAQTVLANGQSSRNGWVVSRGWSGFDAGENQWAFSAVSGSGLLSVTATPAWI